MRMRVVLSADVPGPDTPEGSAALEAHLDDVMDELCEIQDADPAIELDKEAQTVRVLITVEAVDDLDAIATGSAMMRAAIEKVGGAFPGSEGIRTRSVGRELVGA